MTTPLIATITQALLQQDTPYTSDTLEHLRKQAMQDINQKMHRSSNPDTAIQQFRNELHLAATATLTGPDCAINQPTATAIALANSALLHLTAEWPEIATDSLNQNAHLRAKRLDPIITVEDPPPDLNLDFVL